MLILFGVSFCQFHHTNYLRPTIKALNPGPGQEILVDPGTDFSETVWILWFQKFPMSPRKHIIDDIKTEFLTNLGMAGIIV